MVARTAERLVEQKAGPKAAQMVGLMAASLAPLLADSMAALKVADSVQRSAVLKVA